MTPTCPTCGQPAQVTPTRFKAVRHQCCGLHSWDGKPLTDQETHDARKAAHAVFDPLWKFRRRRSDAYRMLAHELSLPVAQAHMSVMDAATARLVPAAVARVERHLEEMETYTVDKPSLLADRPLGVFDLETTGPDYDVDRIVTYAVGVLYPDDTHNMITGVVDSGHEISAKAAEVHGWTNELVEQDEAAEPPSLALERIMAVLKECFHQGYPVVAFNARFDFTLLSRELERCGMDPDLSPIDVVDPLVIDKAIDKYRKGSRRLDAVAAHYGVSLDGWHAADADALVAGAIARKVLRKMGANNAEALYDQQKIWAAEQAASYQSYLRRTEPGAVIEGAWPVVPVKAVA